VHRPLKLLFPLLCVSLCIAGGVNGFAQKPDWEKQLDTVTPQYNSGIASLVIPHLENALAKATQARDIDKQIVGHTKLGQVLLDVRKYPQAISHAQAAIDLLKNSRNPSIKYHSEALETLVRAYGKLGQHQKARTFAELNRNFLLQKKASPEAIAKATCRLALTFAACGDRPKEIPLLEKSLQNAPAFSSNQHLVLRTKLELGLAIWNVYALDTSKLQTAQGKRVTQLMHEICSAVPTDAKAAADINEARGYMNALGLK
jgi:tetratricopeptide (TPR) repeat protein